MKEIKGGRVQDSIVEMERQSPEPIETLFNENSMDLQQAVRPEVMMGREADSLLRKKDYMQEQAAIGLLTPQMAGQIGVGPSPLIQNLFPSFEETMAKYGISVPKS